MTEQEFNKRRAAALLAAAHVCPDKLRKVQMLYEAGELMQAANPYGCNQYGHGWKQAHNGISSKKAPKGGTGGKKDEETEKPADQSKKPTKQPNKKTQNKKPTQSPKSPAKPTKAPVPNTQHVAPSKPTYAPQQPNVPGQTPAKPETPSNTGYTTQQKPQAPVKTPTKAPTQVPAGTTPKPQPSKVPAPTTVQQEPKAPSAPLTNQPNKAPAPLPSGGAKTPMPTPQQEPVAPGQKTPATGKTPYSPQQQQPSAVATKPQTVPQQQQAPKPQSQQPQEPKPTPQQKQPLPTQQEQQPAPTQQQPSEGATKPQTAPGQHYAPQQQAPGAAQQTQPNKAPQKKIPTPQQNPVAPEQKAPATGKTPSTPQQGQQPNKPQATTEPTTAKPVSKPAQQPEQEATNQSQAEKPMSEENKKFVDQAEKNVKQYDKLLSGLDKKIKKLDLIATLNKDENAAQVVENLKEIKDKIKHSKAIAQLAVDFSKNGYDGASYFKKGAQEPKLYEKEIKDAVAKKPAPSVLPKQQNTPAHAKQDETPTQQDNTQKITESSITSSNKIAKDKFESDANHKPDKNVPHLGAMKDSTVSPNEAKQAKDIINRVDAYRNDANKIENIQTNLTPKQINDLIDQRDALLKDEENRAILDKYTGNKYDEINRAQFDESTYEDLDPDSKEIVDRWDKLQNAQTIPEGTVLHRGCETTEFVPMNSDALMNLVRINDYSGAKKLDAELQNLVGKKFKNPNSKSTSTSQEVAERFGKARIEYVAGKNARGLFIGDESCFPSEDEIVIGNMNELTIIGVKVVNGRPIFVVRIDGIPD